jgi:hypothetical protein
MYAGVGILQNFHNQEKKFLSQEKFFSNSKEISLIQLIRFLLNLFTVILIHHKKYSLQVSNLFQG